MVLRGLGDCRFEDANEALGLDAADRRGPPRSARRGRARTRCRRWRSATTSCPGDGRCDDSWLVRPDRRGDALRARRSRSTPGYCTLSMLFSDWSASGRRDLRMSNDRHYYLDGEEQLWRIEPGAAARRRTPRPTGGARCRSGGWASPARTSPATVCPRCSSPARPTTSCRRSPTARPARPTGTSRSTRGVTAQRPVRGRRRAAVDGMAPGVRRRQQRRLRRPVRHQGQRRGADRPGEPGSEQPVDRPGGRHVRRRCRGSRDRRLRPRHAARRSSTSTSTACSISSWSTAARTSTLWRNVGRGDAAQPEAMGHWIDVRLHSRPRTSTPSARGSRCEPATARATREVTVGGGHVSGELGWLHVGHRRRPTRPRCACTWPDGSVGPWMTVHADSRATITRGESSPTPWTPEG